jgi:hypothetical protein
MTAITTRQMTSRISSWLRETPKMLPNRMFVAAVAKPW